MSKVSFTPEQIIKHLEEKGMTFSDHSIALDFFRQNNYYRFRGYFHKYLDKSSNDQSSSKPFVREISFENIRLFYDVDTKLRHIIFSAIQDIEISLRANVALVFGKLGEMAHYDIDNLNANIANEKYDNRGNPLNPEELSNYEFWKTRLQKQKILSKAPFTNDPGNLDIWKCLEIIDFGSLINLIVMMKNDTKKELAKKFGYDNASMFVSHLQHINVIRNKCAHHEKIGDISYTRRGTHVITIPQAWGYKSAYRHGHLYDIILILAKFSQSAGINLWMNSLVNKFNPYLNKEEIEILHSQYGFPDDWEKDKKLWQPLFQRQAEMFLESVKQIKESDLDLK